MFSDLLLRSPEFQGELSTIRPGAETSSSYATECSESLRLGRAIQNCTLPAREHFDKLVARDAAREGGKAGD